MTHLIRLAALLLLPCAAWADVSSLPPSEVQPEEVYTPAQIADQSLNALEKALQQRAAATDDEERTAAEETINRLMNHITANPDLRAEVVRILGNNSERAQKLKALMQDAGIAQPQA